MKLGIILGILLLAGLANAAFGLEITKPVETKHWICPYGVCTFAVVPTGQSPTLEWRDAFWHPWFTINAYQPAHTETWVDENGYLKWKHYPAINITTTLPGNTRKLAVPLWYWDATFYNAQFVTTTICNDWKQCDTVQLYKGNWFA